MHRSILARSGCDTEPSLLASGVNAVGLVCGGRKRVPISAAKGASSVALKSPQTRNCIVPSCKAWVQKKPRWPRDAPQAATRGKGGFGLPEPAPDRLARSD